MFNKKSLFEFFFLLKYFKILINGKNDENGVNQLDDNQSRHSTIRKLDLVSLIVFPVTFVLLNVILITAHYNSS